MWTHRPCSADILGPSRANAAWQLERVNDIDPTEHHHLHHVAAARQRCCWPDDLNPMINVIPYTGVFAALIMATMYFALAFGETTPRIWLPLTIVMVLRRLGVRHADQSATKPAPCWALIVRCTHLREPSDGPLGVRSELSKMTARRSLVPQGIQRARRDSNPQPSDP